MRGFLSLLALIAGLSCAQAQAPHVDRLDSVRAGIFSYDKLTASEGKDISTGKFVAASGLRIKQVTRNIPAELKTVFGIELRVVGSPNGKKAPITILWRYPDPGIKNPDTGTTKFFDEYVSYETIGKMTTFYWTLGNDYVLIPGKWVIELRQGDRKLLAQEFILSKP
jgi:hypothetical protein